MDANRIKELSSEAELVVNKIDDFVQEAKKILADEDERLRNVPEELYRAKWFKSDCNAFDCISSAKNKLNEAAKTLQLAIICFAEADEWIKRKREPK